MKLHQTLRALGFDSRKDRDEQRRTVYRVSDGAVMGSFTAAEAWNWLAEYQASEDGKRQWMGVIE